MAYNTYDVGDLVRLVAGVILSGSYVDPSYLEFTLRRPDGITIDYTYGVDSEVIKESVGNYFVDYYIPTYGQYYYNWFMSGTVWGSEEVMFYVRKPNI